MAARVAMRLAHMDTTTREKTNNPGSQGSEFGRDQQGLLIRIRGGETGARTELAGLFSRGISMLLARELAANQIAQSLERILDAVAFDIRQDASLTGETVANTVRARLKKEISDLRGNPALSAPRKPMGTSEGDPSSRRALARLSSEQKDLLRRHYILEQPRQQICAEMQISEPEFRSLKSGARSVFESATDPKPAKHHKTPLAFRQAAG